MSTFRVSWQVDGYVDVEAKSGYEAFTAFNAMKSTEVMEMGDHGLPMAYHAERIKEL